MAWDSQLVRLASACPQLVMGMWSSEERVGGEAGIVRKGDLVRKGDCWDFPCMFISPLLSQCGTFVSFFIKYTAFQTAVLGIELSLLLQEFICVGIGQDTSTYLK